MIGQAKCCSLQGAASSKWSACSWRPVAKRGLNSHQPFPDWCPDGTFLTQLDLDGDRDGSEYDEPVIGQARCCGFAPFGP